MKAAQKWMHSFGTTSGTNTSFGVFPPESLPIEAKPKKVDVSAAVYSHIRAMRALGRTTVNTAEVAKALSISESDVERAIGDMTGKGVKILG